MFYSAYGLCIFSELPLPDLRRSDQEHADVRIRFGVVPLMHVPDAEQDVSWQAEPGRLLLHIDDVARYLVVDGREIWIERRSGSDDDIRTFLLGSALAALLAQREVLTLHASAVRTERGAVLFMGHSGTGKSTLLAELVKRGFPMMADDVTGIIWNADASPMVLPAFPSTRLWADAVERLEQPIAGLRRVRASLEKYLLPVENFWTEPVKLHAAYALTTHNQSDIRLLPNGPVERFEMLNRFTYRKHFLRALGLHQAHFRMVSRLALSTRIVQVVRPTYPSMLDSLAQHIMEDMG